MTDLEVLNIKGLHIQSYKLLWICNMNISKIPVYIYMINVWKRLAAGIELVVCTAPFADEWETACTEHAWEDKLWSGQTWATLNCESGFLGAALSHVTKAFKILSFTKWRTFSKCTCTFGFTSASTNWLQRLVLKALLLPVPRVEWVVL